MPLFGTLVLSAMLLVLEKMLRLFDFVATEGGPVSVVWRMLANLIPEYLSLGIPIGLTLGILLAFRRLALSSELDVMRADARLAAVEASVPQLQAEQARERNRIATLLGQRPEQLSVDLSPAKLPAIAKALNIGNPGDLLQRRPDIMSAERKLAAATARIGVAKADLFPRVSLSGFLGFTAGRGSQIGSAAANAWALGPRITWPAFDLGSVRARLRGADAQAEGALASYEQQVLLALEESQNAFTDYGKRQQRLVSLIRQSESSRTAADLAVRASTPMTTTCRPWVMSCAIAILPPTLIWG